MIIGSILKTSKLTSALVKDMVHTEATNKVAPKMFQASKQWILNSLLPTSSSVSEHQDHPTTIAEQDQERPQQHSETTPNTSTEYLVYNWLEAMFAWFQVIVLWHDPMVSLCALSGFLSSFLLLTYFAPRFYATIMIALFIYNANKFWFRHVWPAIRVPPERGREEEMILDVDRWTYLHPQLMTLAELNRHLKNLMKILEEYLRKLLNLRQEKPAAFCSLVCLIFSCTAYIGNRISGINLIFVGLAAISTLPGIYQHLLPDLFKHWIEQNICTKILTNSQSESNPQAAPSSSTPATSEQSTRQAASYEPTISAIASKARSIETQALSLFEHFKRRRFNSQDSIPETPSSSSPLSLDHGNMETCDVPNLIDRQQSQTDQDSGQEPKQQQQQQQQHNNIIITGDTNDLNSQREHKRGSDDMSSNDSVSLVDPDDDQQDGFVLL